MRLDPRIDSPLCSNMISANAAFVTPLPLALATSNNFCGRVVVAKRSRKSAFPRSRSTGRQTVRAGLFPWSRDDSSGPPLSFNAGYTYLAHPEKGSGEDAFFIQENSAGVFDGVSGAAEVQGVDPRLYSQTLAALTFEKVKRYGPGSVVKAAIEASKENDQIGASTACVVGLSPGGRLFGVNLGDSGVLIIRDGSKLFRTKEQQHFFNCPYQLTSVTEAGMNSGDSITMGQNIQQNLKLGDRVIMATDGLWDNMTLSEILKVASRVDQPDVLAEQLGDVAMDNSLDKDYISPFMQAAKKAGEKWVGGKVDDITIVCLDIVEEAKRQPLTLLSSMPDQ